MVETLRNRHSLRLKDYDYSQAGAYFVTIGTFERAALFSEISRDEMRLNEAGGIVQQCWLEIPLHFPYVTVDEFVVMPNHVHGIVVINVGAQHAAPLPISPHKVLPNSLSAIVRAFKSAATKGINGLQGTPGAPVWQRNYYEHVIRNDADLNRIRRYSTDNPAHWAEDPENLDVFVGRLLTQEGVERRRSEWFD